MAELKADIGELERVLGPLVERSGLNLAANSTGILLKFSETDSVSLASLSCTGAITFKGVSFKFKAILNEKELEVKLL